MKPPYTHEQLWAEQAKKLTWFSEWEKVLDWNMPFARWFINGTLNASYLCTDVHMQTQAKNKVALYWESEDGSKRVLSYSDLHDLVNQYAHKLRQLGVTRGDVVMLYMPMIPEAIAAMLAIARLGAVHSIVFSGFSALALKDRIIDTQARFVVTADVTYRRGKEIPLKNIVDQAVQDIPFIAHVLIVQRSNNPIILTQPRDVLAHTLIVPDSVYVEPEHMESNEPLFILYTSGTTGKPKGIVHATGGYLTYIYSTLQWAFNPDASSIYWCTADIGWITGHSYVVYAPLLHGLSIVLYEGAPDYPTPGRWWELIQNYKVSIFYTSPTALRMLMRQDESIIASYNLESLKKLGSVGEPINPEVWKWFHDVVGNKRCPVIDTWWQTETGGFMISPTTGLPLVPLKPGSATKPLPGIDATVVDERGHEVPSGTKGYLVIKNPWPGMTVGLHKDPERFTAVYWSKFNGMYYSGDYAIKDHDGYFWLLGRADEVLNIAGHRIGTAEIESAAITHQAVAEAAAIGMHDEIKGECVVIFVILKKSYNATSNLKQEIITAVRQHIGSFITPKDVCFVEKLPKTRSGKIMRRVLKAVLEGATVGDITTLEDEASVDEAKVAYDSVKRLMSLT